MDTGGAPGTTLAQGSFKVTKQYLRYAAHAASDAVFEKLTGIKGAFRTRIAYVVQKNGGQYPYELRVSDYDGYNQFLGSPFLPAADVPGTGLRTVLNWPTLPLKAVVLRWWFRPSANASVRQIASFPQHNGAPAFSPDGSKLAFALSKTGSLNLYVMDLGSGQIRQVTNGRSNNTEPSWFPDSQNLAFTSDRGRSSAGI